MAKYKRVFERLIVARDDLIDGFPKIKDKFRSYLLWVQIGEKRENNQLKSLFFRIYSDDNIYFVFERVFTQESYQKIKEKYQLDVEFENFVSFISEITEYLEPGAHNPHKYSVFISNKFSRPIYNHIIFLISQELSIVNTVLFAAPFPKTSKKQILKFVQRRYDKIHRGLMESRKCFEYIVTETNKRSPYILRDFPVSK